MSFKRSRRRLHKLWRAVFHRHTSTDDGAANPACHSRLATLLGATTIAGYTLQQEEPSTNAARSESVQHKLITSLGEKGEIEMVKNLRASNIYRNGLKILVERTAPDAFKHSRQRFTPPRCSPQTRVEILERIYAWITLSVDRKRWIMWLNGVAGSGKSALMQTIAERCVLEGIAVATFFFSQLDSERNTMANIVATIIYQLIRAIPETEEEVLSIIERNPLVFEQSLENQLQQLLIRPLLHVQRQFSILIDGLDECTDQTAQTNLVKALARISSEKDSPVIFLVASRRENHIQAAFSTIEGLLETMPLDDSQVSEDIRRYLKDQFAEIQRNHQQKALLPANWPPISAISEIIDKASGQFAFASVVIKYISYPFGNPAHRLDTVRNIDLQDPTFAHPLAQLDTLYRYLFSEAENIDKILDILAFHLITTHSEVELLEHVFLLAPGDLETLLINLSPILHIKDNSITLSHISLYDFLQDPERSGKYFCDLDDRQPKLLSIFLDKSFPILLTPPRTSGDAGTRQYWQLYAIKELLENVGPYYRLQCAIINFDIVFENVDARYEYDNTISRIKILESVKRLDFGDKGEAYEHVLDVFARGHAVCWLSHSTNVKKEVRKSEDLWARIQKLRPELAKRPSLEEQTVSLVI